MCALPEELALGHESLGRAKLLKLWARCGQQPVPGQPRSQDGRPERGGVRPGAVAAVEVLAQPAAVVEPPASARARPPSDEHVIKSVS